MLITLLMLPGSEWHPALELSGIPLAMLSDPENHECEEFSALRKEGLYNVVA